MRLRLRRLVRKLRLPAFRLLDWIVVLGGLASVVLSGALVYRSSGDDLVVVIGASSDEWIYPLGEDRTMEVPGPLGVTVVHIREGYVSVHTSPCVNQTCVSSGRISGAGQWLACLPNQVFVRIEGRNDDGSPDAHAF